MGLRSLVGKVELISHLFLHSPDTLVLHLDSNKGDDLDGWYGQESSNPSCNRQPAKKETPNCWGLRNISSECEGSANDVGCGRRGSKSWGLARFEVRHIWGGWTGLRARGKNYVSFHLSAIHMCKIPMLSFLFDIFHLCKRYGIFMYQPVFIREDGCSSN